MKLDHSFMEKIILFHCLTNEAYLTSVIDFLSPGLFDNKNNRDIIDIISNFHDRNKTCPNITEVKALLTTDELKSSFKKVVEEFAHLDKKYNAEELERNTEQFIKEKGVYNTLLETAKMVSEGGADTELILNKFEKACNINLTTDHGIELYSDIDRIVDDLNKTDPVISSGWEWMDKILGGGFKRDGRAIYIYAGRPNVGKSIFLGNIANNISASGHNVLVISLEMSEMVYARRLCSNATAIPLSELQFSSEALKKDMLKIKAGNPDRKIYIKEFPPSTVTPKQISGFINKLISSGIKFDAIVIDYLNLLNSPNGTNLYERVKYITEQLRAMTYVFNCPIITATQLNRCLALDTKVERADGSTDDIINLSVGDEIRGSSNNVKVLHIYPVETQKCYRITTESGKTILCSNNHRFPTATGEIKSISEGLKMGDELFVSKSVLI
jgi:replicative DNA helicase